MRIEEIKWLWKDDNSGGAGCPALLEVPGGYAIQGEIPDEETRAQLAQVAADNGSPLADDEAFLIVPANVLDRLREPQ